MQNFARECTFLCEGTAQNRSPVITMRCMPVRKVSELCLTCSDVMPTCAKNLSRWQGGCVGLRSRALLLSTDCADKKRDGNDWLTTQLNAHWFRQP